MRVFVTGGTGYLGSHIVVALLRAGNQVTVMSRDPGAAGAFAEKGARVVGGSLEDRATIAALLAGQEAVIHNAITWEDETGATDAEASAFLFEAAADAGIEYVIYTSSTAVHRPFKALMTEEDELTPADDYARAKAYGESVLREISERTGMRSSVVRAGPVVGAPAFPGGRINPLRRFSEMASLAQSGGDIVVLKGEGRQFIGASDLAEVYVRLLELKISGTFLAVAQDFITWEWIAREMVAAFGSSSKVLVAGPEPDVVPKFDVGKMERELGLTFGAKGEVRNLIQLLPSVGI